MLCSDPRLRLHSPGASGAVTVTVSSVFAGKRPKYATALENHPESGVHVYLQLLRERYKGNVGVLRRTLTWLQLVGAFRISLLCVKINFRLDLRALELFSFCFILSRRKGTELIATSIFPLCSPIPLAWRLLCFCFLYSSLSLHSASMYKPELILRWWGTKRQLQYFWIYFT